MSRRIVIDVCRACGPITEGITGDDKLCARCAVARAATPQYWSLGALAAQFDRPGEYACRAWRHGYIRPVAWLNDRPCFDATAIEGLRHYMAGIRPEHQARAPHMAACRAQTPQDREKGAPDA